MSQDHQHDTPALDVLAVLLLSGLVLLPLSTSFTGIGWLVVGAVGAGTGIVLGMVARSYRWPGPVYAVVCMCVYFLLACPAPSLERDLSQMLPTPAGLLEALRNTVGAWGDLLGTLPRVDSEGAAMLVPLVLTYAGAALSAGLALLTRRPVLPVLPLLVSLAVSLALGRDAGPWPELTGVGFACVALLWVVVRAAAVQGSGFGVRRWLAAVVVLALAAALAPALQGQVAGQTPRLHLRTTAARGADVSNIETPLKRFRRFTKQAPGTYDNVHDTVLMRVKGVRQGSRLRFAALDTYDGEAWRPNPDTSPRDSDARFLRLDSTIDNPSPGRRQKVHVEIRYAWRLRWLPTIGALDSLEFDRIESSSRRDNVVFNPATQTALMGEVVRGVDDYHFTARVPDDRLTPRMEAAQGVDEALYVRASYLNRIAEQYRRRTPTPMRALFAAARALKREGRYSNGATEWEAKRYPAGNDAKRLGVGFVLAPQMVGDDEQYAATMALLAARLDIPARVVVGAVVPRSGVVRGRDVHAWIEVQLSDGSWRTMPTETFMGDRPPKRKVPGKLPPNISTWDPPPPRQAQQPQQEPQQPKKPKKEQEQPPAHDSPRIPLWPLAALVLIGAIPLAKWWRRRRRRDAARTSRRIVGAWDELTDSARDLGAEWSAGDTRPAEARSMGTPVELAQRADLLVYAAREPSDEDVADYWRDIDTAIGAFRRRQPRWRQIVAPINPLSLLKRR